jgi:hypothetical protein
LSKGGTSKKFQHKAHEEHREEKTFGFNFAVFEVLVVKYFFLVQVLDSGSDAGSSPSG